MGLSSTEEAFDLLNLSSSPNPSTADMKPSRSTNFDLLSDMSKDANTVFAEFNSADIKPPSNDLFDIFGMNSAPENNWNATTSTKSEMKNTSNIADDFLADLGKISIDNVLKLVG